MDRWLLVTASVAVFAFLLEVRPMDSFLTAYLTSPKVNATLDEVSNVITPIRIYASMFGTILVSLFADCLQYKPVMVLNGFIGILTYICLMNSPTLFRLKLFEVGLSMFTCTEISYIGYTYAKIQNKDHYQIATGYIKGGMLSGRCVSGLVGQLVVYLNSGDYSPLNFCSLSSLTLAFIWVCFMPAVERDTSVCAEDGASKADSFSRKAILDQDIPKYSAERDEPPSAKVHPSANLVSRVYTDFKMSYTDPTVLKWSFWHVVCLSAYIQVFLYVNILYTYIADMTNDKVLLNGAVDFLATISGAVCSYNIGKLNVHWNRHGNAFLMISSLALGLALCFCCYSTNIISVYALYIFYFALVQSAFVIIMSEIAKRLKDNCFTLILGFNNFLATVLSTCFSVLLVYFSISVPGKVSDELTPIRLYVGAFGTLLVFLVSDYLRYKPIMIFNGLIGVVGYACLMYSPSVFRLKVAEASLALFSCAEMSYFGYTYAAIKIKEHYQRATGCVKAGMLSGKCVSGVLGQLLVYLYGGDYSILNYYSLASLSIASVWACFLPSVQRSAYFYAVDDTAAGTAKAETFSKAAIRDPDIPKYSGEKVDPPNADAEPVVDQTTSTTNPFRRIYEDFKQSYTNRTVLLWSFWQIVGLGTYTQVSLYVNILYTYVVDETGDKQPLLNGAVDSIATISAAFWAYKTGNLNVDWTRSGNSFLTFASLVLGLTLCLCGYFKNIFIVYALFIVYASLVQSVSVIVLSQVAKNVKDDCYILVLGFNAFISIGLSSCASTLLGSSGLAVPDYFLVYGGTYVVLGILYGCVGYFKEEALKKRFTRLP